MPLPGVPGLRGAGAESNSGAGDGDPYVGPPGGAGGGSLTLIARQLDIAGTVSADGAQGGNGGMGTILGQHTFNNIGTGNAGGGSGGGILLVAQDLQLTGTISVLGGDSGQFLDTANYIGAESQPSGGPGRVTVLTNTLYAPAGDLPVIGPLLLGHTLPVDPAPPPQAGRYFPSTGHAISGLFLASWHAWGAGDMLGRPLTDAFVDGGVTVQYLERAELLLVQGRVQLALLGRQLTRSRNFQPVPAFTSTGSRQYFPATHHSLAGNYLTFWQTHQGATLLGAPISEVVVEGNGDGSGRRYAVQWFERGRLEAHPENRGTPYAMQIGLCGVQALQVLGWLP